MGSAVRCFSLVVLLACYVPCSSVGLCGEAEAAAGLELPAVVALRAPGSPPSSQSVTGWFLDDSGLVLASALGPGSLDTAEVVGPDGATAQAQRVGQDLYSSIALFRVDPALGGAAAVDWLYAPRRGERVRVIALDTQASAPRTHEGIVSASPVRSSPKGCLWMYGGEACSR